jgi:hypothetical protein
MPGSDNGSAEIPTSRRRTVKLLPGEYQVRVISVALIASAMLITPAAFADELVIDPGVGPEFHTYVEKEKVRTYDGDIVDGADLPDTYELAPVPGVIVTKYPTLKSYRYVRVGKRIAIVSPKTRKVVKFID